MTAKPPFGMLAKLAEFHKTGRQTKPLYEEWSPTYDDDLVRGYGYTAHLIAADAFARHTANRDQRIVDVGCGTGLVGVELARHGFARIDGVDISEKMLAEAAKKKIYAALLAGDIMAGADIGEGAYDSAICVGSFGTGHLGPEGFREICRFVVPGGLIVAFVNARPFLEDDYSSHLRRLEEERIWKVEDVQAHNYMTEVDRPGRLIIAHRA